uniref:Pectinesterase inhibitor domain-containing protein n=1 Tax=Leersia perrieri TaxID=77586 RepID=A0A0D9XWK0_9ORYZ
MASSSSNGVLFALFLFAVNLAAPHLAATIGSSSPAFLSGACNTVAGDSGGVITAAFCTNSLSSDGRSLNASSYSDLTIVAIDLLTSNATSTKSKIDTLLQNATTATKQCLQSCQAAYAGVLQAQTGVFYNVQAGRFPEAMSALEKSAGSVEKCEDGFGKSNVKPLLTAEDDDAFRLAKLAALLLHQEH